MDPKVFANYNNEKCTAAKNEESANEKTPARDDASYLHGIYIIHHPYLIRLLTDRKVD